MELEILTWAGQFSLPLVGLALLVCTAGSLTVFALLGRAAVAPPRLKYFWLGGVCISFGADVWATHFIAMLAFMPQMPVAYRVAPTIVSIVIAICGSALPFAAIMFQRPSRLARTIAGAILGLVIGAMHFVGMSAMQLAAPPSYDPVFCLAALASGMTLCAVSLNAVGRPDQPGIGRATLFLVLAICSLHFIAMGGFAVAPPANLRSSATPWLALTVAGVSGLILFAAFSAVTADLKFAALQLREAATLNHLARHDELTNLPNRLYLRERLAQAIAAPPELRHFALFHINLDHFKPINDLFGHHAGDLLLTQIAERIQATIRDTDMAARLGGDEFIILQRGGNEPAQAAALAERLVRGLAEPITLADRTVEVGASIGIAFYPGDGMLSGPADGIEDVLRNADTALSSAKAESGNCYRFYQPQMSEYLLTQRTLQQDLRAAIEHDELELHYQPIFACGANRLIGFEALVRWRHPLRGMVPPMEFIPYAEQSGLIVKLGIWVLKTACIEAATWPHPLRIAVNLSPVQLKREKLDQTILAVLSQSGLPASRLELEVTENALIESPEQARATMLSLKTHGVQFAIDDFGTGYSSLSSLRSFPFDRIKIDRSFVHSMQNDEGAAVIVRTIIGLGHSLRIGVLAEGVETQEQLDLLTEQGCDHIQGYFLGRPIPTAAISGLIENKETVLF